jgi:hypothetical protein
VPLCNSDCPISGITGQYEYSLDRGASQIAEFILFLDKVFDSLHANSKIASQNKPLEGRVTCNSSHEAHWREAIKILQSFKFYSEDQKKIITNNPSITNFIHTIKGFIYLKSVLLEKCKFSYFLPRSSNQDALEIVI